MKKETADCHFFAEVIGNIKIASYWFRYVLVVSLNISMVYFSETVALLSLTKRTGDASEDIGKCACESHLFATSFPGCFESKR